MLETDGQEQDLPALRPTAASIDNGLRFRWRVASYLEEAENRHRAKFWRTHPDELDVHIANFERRYGRRAARRQREYLLGLRPFDSFGYSFSSDSGYSS